MSKENKKICRLDAFLLPFVLVAILAGSGGCGVQQREQAEDAGQVTTGAAVYVDVDGDSETVKHQLEVMVENASKWRITGDEDEDNANIVYAVTDLDHNGRLEIMALKNDWEGMEPDDYFLQGCFEVNSSEDGITAIETDQIQEISLGETMEMLDTAYYDSKTGEYHYVMGSWLTEEEMLSDESGDYYKNIIALTLKNEQITSDTLAYQMQNKNQSGKMQSRFYQVRDTGQTEIDASLYSVEGLGDAVYTDCEKQTVRFSVFSFDHSLEDMTEIQMHHALEKSYQRRFVGYPLGRKNITVAHQKVAIPQYSMMQDQNKQKRINQMIVKQVEQIVNQVDDTKDLECEITIKYAGRDRVSLLVQVDGCGKGEAKGNTICDTINIDLEQERILFELDLLPESDRQEAIEMIRYEIGDEYDEEADEENHSNDVLGNWMDNLKKWSEMMLYQTRDMKWSEMMLYQTRDMIGVVIPTGLEADPYVIHETWNEWEEESEGVSYAEIDWEAYQYKMFASEYQGLQEYMPVLTGETEFNYIQEEPEDDETVLERQNVTIRSWVEEFLGEDFTYEDLTLYRISVCDLTQDGKPEVILEFGSLDGAHLVLHKERDAYYGMIFRRRSLIGLQKNGVYSAGKNGLYLYQVRFKKDTFVESYLGGYEYPQHMPMPDDEHVEEYIKYYIRDQEVEKDVYEKWEKSITEEEVCWYTPEARDKR